MSAVMTGVSLEDRSLLIQTGGACIEVLMMDSVWTLAVDQRDVAAPAVGRHMQALIEAIREQSSRVSEVMLRTRITLNAAWPGVREQLQLSGPELDALDGYVATYGGLGDLGVAIAAELDQSLAEESEELATKIADFEASGQSAPDLSPRKRIMLAAFSVCVFAIVALPVTGVVIATTGAAAALMTSAVVMAGVGAGITGAELVKEGG